MTRQSGRCARRPACYRTPDATPTTAQVNAGMHQKARTWLYQISQRRVRSSDVNCYVTRGSDGDYRSQYISITYLHYTKLNLGHETCALNVRGLVICLMIYGRFAMRKFARPYIIRTNVVTVVFMPFMSSLHSHLNQPLNAA